MMSDLTRIYDDNFKLHLNVECHDYGKYHIYHLRERIENHFPNLISIKDKNML